MHGIARKRKVTIYYVQQQESSLEVKRGASSPWCVPGLLCDLKQVTQKGQQSSLGIPTPALPSWDQGGQRRVSTPPAQAGVPCNHPSLPSLFQPPPPLTPPAVEGRLTRKSSIPHPSRPRSAWGTPEPSSPSLAPLPPTCESPERAVSSTCSLSNPPAPQGSLQRHPTVKVLWKDSRRHSAPYVRKQAHISAQFSIRF